MSSLHVPVMPSEEYGRHLIIDALGSHGWMLDSMLQLFKRVLTPEMLLHPDIGNPIEHHTIVLEHIVQIAEEYSGASKPPLFRAACLALLHDICPTPKVSAEAIDAAIDDESKSKLAEQRLENRRIHMREGSRMAREILQELRAQSGALFAELLTNESIDQICYVISIHDNSTIGIPLPENFSLAHTLREADRLWMVTKHGIRVDLSRRGVDPDDPDAFLDQAQRNIGKFMGERRDVYGEVPCARFKDNCTFFRTTPGYQLYCRYCAEILQHTADKRRYVRND